MITRLYKNTDGSVFQCQSLVKDEAGNPIFPVEYDTLSYVEYPSPQYVPKPDVFEKLYFKDDVVSLQSVSVDSSWENNLMPVDLIKSKHTAHLTACLSDELAKETPDVIKAMSLQLQLQKLPTATEKELYEIAKNSLDRADVPKPKIAAKLAEKLAE